MTAFRLFRSTVFRLTVAAVVVLCMVAAVVIAVAGWDANRVLTQTVEQAIESDAVRFRSELASGGFDALAAAVTERSAGAGTSLYYLSDVSGRKVAGNLLVPPTALKGGNRGGIFDYRPASGGENVRRAAAGIVVDIAGGGRLVVAHDVESQRALLGTLSRNLVFGLGALVLLGVASGLLLARHILRRIDAMGRASEAIMTGDLSGRIPRQGSGDELDRLADHLNRMLDRIENLMIGLREVSDNIAHDLKTPLNRLRNRAETALADPRGGPAWRDGLERTIEEADELIKTFNALLLIARLEAGAVEETLEPLDLATIVRDVAELYQPAAEDIGFQIAVDAPTPVPVRANRQLIGQAMANLIDNAIKYASGHPQPADRIISVAAVADARTATISVGDHGPGIPAADRERVLRRFVRLEASRTRPGTGLGLSLVAAVAHAHHGEIRLEDNQPGVRVVLALPLAPERSFVPQSELTVSAPVEKAQA